MRDDGRSGVLTFKVDPSTGRARQIGERDLEADACYVSTDKTGRYLLAAYLAPGMVTTHAIGADGAVGALVDRWETAPYAHSIITDPSNRFALAPHVTPTDVVRVFRFDAASGKLSPAATPALDTPSGHGPRHLAFHPTLDALYANAESASSVDVYAFDRVSGGLRLTQSLSTLPDGGFDGANSTGTTVGHPDGRAVYVANRGHDSVAAFTADAATGRLAAAGHAPTRAIPRTLGLPRGGDVLFAGSDADGVISSYAIAADGTLTPIGERKLGAWPSWILPLEFP